MYKAAPHLREAYLQVADNAVRLLLAQAAGGRGLQILFSANQQVSSGWVTATMHAAVGLVRLLGRGASQDCGDIGVETDLRGGQGWPAINK